MKQILANAARVWEFYAVQWATSQVQTLSKRVEELEQQNKILALQAKATSQGHTVPAALAIA